MNPALGPVATQRPRASGADGSTTSLRMPGNGLAIAAARPAEAMVAEVRLIRFNFAAHVESSGIPPACSAR